MERLIDKVMKSIKIKCIEILTNGSLNITVKSLMESRQVFLYKKDYKSLELAQKQKNISKFEISNNFHKTHYKF